jgi:outer membrane protein
MMKTCIVAALLFGAAAPIALAQDAPRQPKIAVIDMQKVSSESLLGKGYAAQLEQLKNEIDAEGNKKQDELDKQGSVLSPEAADKKRQEIVKKTRERQAYLEDGQQDLQRMRERAQQQAQALNNEFQVKIKPHIDAVAKEKGIDILLDSQVAITVSKDFDISREVIVKADDAERTAKGAAAKPAPKPNTPPAPKP